MSSEPEQAVVIGGSLAGMCAARVLSERYRRVVIVERDRLDDDVDTHRRGVPQAVHGHGLLARGRQAFEHLFPGFGENVRARGALEFDMGTHIALMRARTWVQRAPSGLSSLWCSRGLLEAAVRERLNQRSNVTWCDGSSVVGLEVTGGRSARVTGVRVEQGTSQLDLRADIVVDAAGRGSKAPRWLKEAGVEPPEEIEVSAHVGYATRWFTIPTAHREYGWKGIWIHGLPPGEPHGAVMFPVEGQRYIVSAVGFNRSYPPHDEAGFFEFISQLRSPAMSRALQDAKPLSGVVTSRSTGNRLRLYHRWDHPLQGFLALGDSVAAFNPVYGQGMTVAGRSAEVLAASLSRESSKLNLKRLGARFHQQQARMLRLPWSMAIAADFEWPQTSGQKPLSLRVAAPVVRAVLDSAFEDPEILRAITPLFHLLRDERALLSWDVAGRVTRRTLDRLLRQTEVQVPQSAPNWAELPSRAIPSPITISA